LFLAVLVAVNLFRAAVVDPSAQQGGTCTNLPVSYYNNARDIKVYLHNTDVNIIQQGEGAGVSGSTPPCDAYLLMYAFMCAGLLFGLSLLLYVLASIYTERLVRVRGIINRLVGPLPLSLCTTLLQLQRAVQAELLDLAQGRGVRVLFFHLRPH
jgi:hypothetical protein